MQIKDKDAAAQPAVTPETPAAEAVKEVTTKAMPGDVQGTMLDKADCHFIFPRLHLCMFFLLYFILAEIPTPVTEPHASRHPRFLTPNRAKRNAKTRCPERVSLSGVSSLKGPHCYSLVLYLCIQYKYSATAF